MQKQRAENSNKDQEKHANKNISKHTHPVFFKLTPHCIAIFSALNHHVVSCRNSLCFIHSRSDESKKNINGYRLKSFFTLCDESVREKRKQHHQVLFMMKEFIAWSERSSSGSTCKSPLGVHKFNNLCCQQDFRKSVRKTSSEAGENLNPKLSRLTRRKKLSRNIVKAFLSSSELKL